mmetsp:Transcript_30768/g.95186  ORF Transcript_30768/g.95186 Transcript_30768/m.95186 type:complete len:112 (+) Transcript_30768:1088-1423(+)
MMKYISDAENLKIVMILLRNKKSRIQIEAFHVFKVRAKMFDLDLNTLQVFVVNPHKPDKVSHVLFNNKDKLVNYFRKFHNDKRDDQFTEEKQLMVDTLLALASPRQPTCDE